MTNPKKKPAPKGVPMPRSLTWLECCWREDKDGYLYPFVRRWNFMPECGGLEKEEQRVNRWLANPRQPKGVRR